MGNFGGKAILSSFFLPPFTKWGWTLKENSSRPFPSRVDPFWKGFFIQGSELQIRGGIEHNSKIFFSYFSTKRYVVTPHYNRLGERVLMIGSNIRFKEYYGKLSMPGRVAQSVGHLTHKSGVLGSIPGLATYFRFSFRFFKKGSCQLLAKVCARSTG